MRRHRFKDHGACSLWCRSGGADQRWQRAGDRASRRSQRRRVPPAPRRGARPCGGWNGPRGPGSPPSPHGSCSAASPGRCPSQRWSRPSRTLSATRAEPTPGPAGSRARVTSTAMAVMRCRSTEQRRHGRRRNARRPGAELVGRICPARGAYGGHFVGHVGQRDEWEESCPRRASSAGSTSWFPVSGPSPRERGRASPASAVRTSRSIWLVAAKRSPHLF